MRILSKSICDYIDLNYDINAYGEVNEEKLLGVGSLIINNYDYSMNPLIFYPNELSYFKMLKSCTFMNFEISDDILRGIDLLSGLNKIVFDGCFNACQYALRNNVESIALRCSDSSLVRIGNEDVVRSIVVDDCQSLDISDIIKYHNLESLVVYNCDIKNSIMLKSFKNISEIIFNGCRLDDDSIVHELENIIRISKNYQKII